ncbi:hypothetical protein O3M35_001417 [Rhynocoris fuscipes]|uniref:Large subunit GTPase 1 homolog n=1 Tax=Rhynocoris fuscipes TaxID=488301 RepID=A0AAW1CNU6_9HEMI
MGKKNKTGLGRSLIKDRFSKKGFRNNDSMLHTSELNDGYDWGRLNLQSVTEESSFQEFLSTAELAGTEFQAEKLNIKFVNNQTAGLLTRDQHKQFLKDKEAKKELLKIPRRPKWDENTTAEELQAAEKESFLEWRRKLAILQEEDNMILTPYEKNLDFWRQLWRVVERSDLVVQILDGRNPLLFRSEDLEKYVLEIDSRKKNLLLINKSDFLTESQRKYWANYFDSINVRAVFFSATKVDAENNDVEDDECYLSADEDKEIDEDDYFSAEEELTDESLECSESSDNSLVSCKNSSKLLDRSSLIELFEKQLKPEDYRVTEGITTVGFVGYPNVGKSSTINALLAEKKVPVSATPGKTKHFQTLYLTPDILICDCPGLVMPSFVATKAEMVLNGILPVDQLRDHVPPIAMIGTLIPRNVLESQYGIMIPRPTEGEDPDRCPTHEEILNAYAYSRGFMTQNGQPDNARAARYILKDFVQGKLLYCVAPPGVDQQIYHKFKSREKKPAKITPMAGRAIGAIKVSAQDLDKEFFKKNSKGVHKQGFQKFGPLDLDNMDSVRSNNTKEGSYKPWKDHSEKRNKREKLRRVYRHLDEV